MGQVTGGSTDGVHNGTAFLWDPAEGMMGIGWLADFGGSEGYAINSFGHVAGVSSSAPGGQAFLWMPPGDFRVRTDESTRQANYARITCE